MASKSLPQKLRYLSPDLIDPNPENPRLVFRQDEMESLMLSIDTVGIQVPLAVFENGDRFTLIDGERRWKCAKKLNLRSIPALVQERPSELENLLLMYNIHSLREQWDYYTIASKLERIIELYEEENFERPGEIVLSRLTGLSRGAIRRCYLLIDLPDRFKNMLLNELERPKSQQRLSEDLFIEMEKSLKTVTRRLPEYAADVDAIRDVLVVKYQSNVISAVTDFRQLSKIATAVDGLGVAHRRAKVALDRVFNPNEPIGIKAAYEEAVAFEYDERKAYRNITALTEFLDEIKDHEGEELDRDLVDSLTELYQRLKRFFGA